MTLPSSATVARHAVMTALSTVTAMPRHLTSDQLFRLTSADEVAQNPADLKAKPGALVIFRDPVLDGEMENGSSIVMHYTVQITTWYWSGNTVLRTKIGSELDKALERIEADEHRLRAALCYPGALATYSGNETGLTALRSGPESYRAVGPDPAPTRDEAARVLKVVHFFRASIDLLQPT